MAENETKPTQAVSWSVGVDGAKCFVRFTTPGVPPIVIPMEPQAAFEMGEKMARAAHQARFGRPAQSDTSYLHEQIKSRVTEQMRVLLINRVSVMLNSTREDRTMSNGKLALELVDTILTKVA